jgi:hypothetical protein
VPLTTIGIYDFRAGHEAEGHRLLETQARFVRDHSRVQSLFVGAALDTPRRYLFVATYADGRQARAAEEAYRRQAAAGGAWHRLHQICAGPPTHHRLLHD